MASPVAAKTITVVPPPMPAGMDPAYYSLSLLRRRKLDECVAVSTYHLNKSLLAAAARESAPSPSTAAGGTPGGVDELLWSIQTRAIVLQSWFDDAEIEDDGVDDVLLEGEQAVVSTAHRPATSLRAARQGTAGAGGGGAAGATRGAGLGTASGRPISSRYGFARPGTLSLRPGSVAQGGRGRGGTAGGMAAPVTGRLVRVGTASLQAVPGGPHINVQRLNVEKIARERPMVAKLLCDYLLYVEHKPKLALELCTAALQPPPSGLSGGGGGGELGAGGGGGALPPGLPRPPGPAPAMGLPPMRLGPGAAPHTTTTTTTSTSSSTSTTAAGPRYREQAGITRAQDWWWKERLGKANYQLGLLREAEKHFKASLFDRGVAAGPVFGGSSVPLPTAPAGGGRGSGSGLRASRFLNYHTTTLMELGKVYSKMDQPLTALELYTEALMANPVDHHMLLCSARLHDALHQSDRSLECYQQVLRLDSSNVEAIACTAAHFFYERNQPELALRFYRRLLQMGVATAEIWNNIGLCAFYSAQLDFALSCFHRALTLCTGDAQRADVWYNVGHIGVGVGDMRLAERAFKLAVAADATHAEAINNLGVLMLEREAASRREGRQRLEKAVMVAPELVEALYNAALLAYEAGELEQANKLVVRALAAYPDHTDSVALQAKLREAFLAL